MTTNTKVILIAIGVATTLVAGALYYSHEPPLPPFGGDKIVSELDFNGKKIKIDYTDDNTNEDLIIKTDKQTYGGWNSSEVYFSIENISSKDQNIDIQFLFEKDELASSIHKLVKDIPYQINVSDYGEKEYDCSTLPDEIPTVRFEDKKRICLNSKAIIGTHKEIRYKDEWQKLELINSTSKSDRVPDKFKSKTTKASYSISTGQIAYFKADIEFPKQSGGEFYIEAIGDKGGIGILDPWYNSNWGYKKSITIQNGKVATTSASFAVLATSTDADLSSKARADGFDIIFVDDDDATLLNFEREYWNNSTGEMVYWIKTDISSTTDKVINMYYGNASASDQATTTGVWDDKYVGVWHLSNVASASSTDSTKNNLNGTAYNGASSTPDGTLDGGFGFDGTDDYVDIGNSALLNLTGSMTVSMWIKADSDANNQFIVDKHDSAVENWFMSFETFTNGLTWMRTTAGSEKKVLTGALSTATWYNIVGTYKLEARVEVYVNSISKGTTAATGAVTNDANAPLHIGQYPGGSLRFDGTLDEVRVMNVALTDADILTEYNNQVEMTTFLVFGAEEAAPAVSAPPIDSTQIIIWED